jgi:hypothetical protein
MSQEFPPLPPLPEDPDPLPSPDPFPSLWRQYVKAAAKRSKGPILAEGQLSLFPAKSRDTTPPSGSES